MESLLSAARQFKTHTDDKETDRQTQRDSVTETDREANHKHTERRQTGQPPSNKQPHGLANLLKAKNCPGHQLAVRCSHMTINCFDICTGGPKLASHYKPDENEVKFVEMSEPCSAN